jgi:hypothetical protein
MARCGAVGPDNRIMDEMALPGQGRGAVLCRPFEK